MGWREPSAPYYQIVSNRSSNLSIRKDTYSESTSAPGATTVDLVEVGELTEGVLVTQRNVDEAVVGESAHASNSGGLLATSEGTGRDEQTGVLASVATGGPDGTRGIPEGLPLSGEVSVTSGDTEKDGIVLQEVVGLSNGVAGLGRGVHLGQDVLGKSLANPRYTVRRDAIRDSQTVESETRRTGRYRPGHQRPQCPSSQPRPAFGCGRTASTREDAS